MSKIPFPDKYDFYKRCKTQYEKLYARYWDKENVEDLIKLCDKLNQTFDKDYDFVSAKKINLNSYFEIFACMIKNKTEIFQGFVTTYFFNFFEQGVTVRKI